MRADRKIDTHPEAATRTPLVVAVVVTWNRRDMVANALHALSRQDYDLNRLHVVVVDNASTDQTTEHLTERYSPERRVENHAKVAHEPDFRPEPLSKPNADTRNKLGFGSLTLIRNHDNFGGCGGFNTGFHYVKSLKDDGLAVDFIWLVDDDAEAPPPSLDALTSAASEDPAIGIVGSRTVDATDRQTTIESTIYFDFNRGRMGDLPTPNHRLRADHDEWVERIGGTKGRRDFQGVRDVDVVSACSLLARWSAVERVGFWDERYFIYCDDADWCLRMGRAGYRVVCNLDAVVYHTPWNLKLTPARLYYAQRNLIWTMQKLLPKWRLRYATFRWMLAITRQSILASFNRRRTHASVLRRTINDVITGRSGKIELDAPPYIDEIEAFREAGAIGAGRTVVAVCSTKRALKLSTDLRVRVADAVGEEAPSWIEIVGNHVSGAYATPDPPGPSRIIYSPRWRSRIRRQFEMIGTRPDAVVITDNVSGFPVWRGDVTIHIDRDKPGMAQVQIDTLVSRLGHATACVLDLARIGWFCLTMRPTR